ncbi:MAG: HipA N-terminal domain-containing protein [Bacteroidota bacterium]
MATFRKIITIVYRRLLPESMRETHALQVKVQKQTRFVLKFKGKPIGLLSHVDGIWRFQYSNWFRSQSQIQPLKVFPDVNRVYESEVLPPFFASRIPSLKQPQVRKVLKQKGLNEHDLSEMLVHFGKNTISNPYILEPSKEVPSS